MSSPLVRSAPAAASSSPLATDHDHIDTVIVGTGPSALILSFILHGNVPYYDPEHPHPDPILHKKLSQSPCLLQLDVQDLTAHFDASRISYSTQALPINVLLDTLLRPLSDVEPGEYPPSLVWKYEPDRAVKHILIGDAPQTGGQWASNPVDASWDIGTLSYLEQLSLPKYTVFDHFKSSPKSLAFGCERPTRRQIADYLAAYPAAVGIQDSIKVGTASGISRADDGFHIASHNLRCRHLVLASGIFTKPIPPQAQLQGLEGLKSQDGDREPLLVIGSGFSAADVILSSIEKRKIIHVFRWMPDERPSPLQACHPQAYPDYAGVYRQMKRATRKQTGDDNLISPTPRKQKQFFDEWIWSDHYVGLANAEIANVELLPDAAIVHFRLPDGEQVTHRVSSLAHVIGRRGSLAYLSQSLRREVTSSPGQSADGYQEMEDDFPVSSRTLRDKVEISDQVAPNVFVIGSLTGDSLIRFGYGSCVESAGIIISNGEGSVQQSPASSMKAGLEDEKVRGAMAPGTCALNGLDGAAIPVNSVCEKVNNAIIPSNGGHEDLGRAPVSSSEPRLGRWARRKSSCLISWIRGGGRRGSDSPIVGHAHQ